MDIFILLTCVIKQFFLLKVLCKAYITPNLNLRKFDPRLGHVIVRWLNVKVTGPGQILKCKTKNILRQQVWLIVILMINYNPILVKHIQYSQVPNCRTCTRIFFQKFASLYGLNMGCTAILFWAICPASMAKLTPV